MTNRSLAPYLGTAVTGAARRTTEIAVGTVLSAIIIVTTDSTFLVVVGLVVPPLVVAAAAPWLRHVEADLASIRLRTFAAAGCVACAAVAVAGSTGSAAVVIAAALVARSAGRIAAVARPFLVGSALRRHELAPVLGVTSFLGAAVAVMVRAHLVTGGRVWPAAAAGAALTLLGALAFQRTGVRPSSQVVTIQAERPDGTIVAALCLLATSLLLTTSVIPASTAKRFDLTVSEILGWSWGLSAAVGGIAIIAVPLALRCRSEAAVAVAIPVMGTGSTIAAASTTPAVWVTGMLLWTIPACVLGVRASVELALAWAGMQEPRPAPVAFTATLALPVVGGAAAVALAVAAVVDRGGSDGLAWAVGVGALALGVVVSRSTWAARSGRQGVEWSCIRAARRLLTDRRGADVHEILADVATQLARDVEAGAHRGPEA